MQYTTLIERKKEVVQIDPLVIPKEDVNRKSLDEKADQVYELYNQCVEALNTLLVIWCSGKSIPRTGNLVCTLAGSIQRFGTYLYKNGPIGGEKILKGLEHADPFTFSYPRNRPTDIHKLNAEAKQKLSDGLAGLIEYYGLTLPHRRKKVKTLKVKI